MGREREREKEGDRMGERKDETGKSAKGHFSLRLHALTSVGSSTSQKVLECLTAGLGHSVRPWESPTKS